MTTITISESTLEAFQRLDEARKGTRCGYKGCIDAFGGTFLPANYEGLVGLYRLRRGYERVADGAWDAIHKASSTLKAAGVVRDYDPPTSWWAVDAPGRQDVRCRSLRGARGRVTRYGGKVEGRGQWIHGQRRAERELVQIRGAVRTALACEDVAQTLIAEGIMEDHDTLCRQRDGLLFITGLRWLAGELRETNGGFPVEQARQFAEGGELTVLKTA